MEIWKPIEGFDNYMISNLGRVKSCKYGKERIMKPLKDKYGYLAIHLLKDKKSNNKRIHRLVALAFIPNVENKPCIDHINTNRSDNRVENLRWVTYKENNNNPLTNEKRSINSGNLGKFGKLSHYHKPTLQFSKDGEFIRKWDCARDIQRELGFDEHYISSCCNKRRKTANGFIWRHYDLELYLESKLFKVFGIKNKKVA